ncbi:hypothetical protein [Congregibacter sp.]|uniref:hypothetical protein n=1 Tax=Congregibacter sp. TaxID=2744308 RepID=UPI003F6C9425
MFLRIFILIASLGAAAEIAASSTEALKRDYLQVNKTKVIAEIESQGNLISVQSVPDGCITEDLSDLIVPSDALTGTFNWFGDTASGKIWREACENDSTLSAVVLQLTPDEGAPPHSYAPLPLLLIKTEHVTNRSSL